MARETCCPIYVTDQTGWLASCGRFYRIWSVQWLGQDGVTGSLRLEDVLGRTLVHMRSSCDTFRAFTKPVESDGIFVRTIASGTTVYIQVE